VSVCSRKCTECASWGRDWATDETDGTYAAYGPLLVRGLRWVDAFLRLRDEAHTAGRHGGEPLSVLSRYNRLNLGLIT
jgi:hypothetical protein